MNASLPSAAIVQNAGCLIEGAAGGRGPSAGDPVAAVVTGDSGGAVGTGRRSAAAAGAGRTTLCLSAGGITKVRAAGIGSAGAGSLTISAARFGGALHERERVARRRGALAAWRDDDSAIAASAASRRTCHAWCATEGGRSGHRGHVPASTACRGHASCSDDGLTTHAHAAGAGRSASGRARARR